ncbi:MAG: TonB-dependent receptor [Mediterranea sp.]|nr:TonB-dependent receptor [Mediterranea sp.]
MKRNHILIALSLLTLTGKVKADAFIRDTIRVVNVEEVNIIATPKENHKLREQPAAVTSVSQQEMQAGRVASIKSLTGIVPNMFIPDYGSKLTSAIYIRGVGSRINTPSVGLYVDNIPYIDKSTFDFNYAGIERIDVLRGPQGTLYGRNAMAGLIHIHTKSPFSYQGTDLRLSAGTRDQYSVSLTRYHRISDTFAFSAGGFYGHSGGVFRNSYDNRKMDKMNEAGGRMRAIYFLTHNLKIDLSVNYEYSDQGGYPYFHAGRISINDDSNYRRHLLNTGLNMEYQATDFVFSAVTGYLYMKDRMFLDQDFTEKDLFNLEQKQRLNTVSEELVLKSKPGRSWQWTTGTFGFYQGLKTNAPVTFKTEGVEQLIEDHLNTIFAGFPAHAPQMSMSVNNRPLLVDDHLETPAWNGAVYHQSTFNHLFVDGLSFTAGLRLDYERNNIRYNCNSDIDFNFKISMPAAEPRPPVDVTIPNMKAPARLAGKFHHDYFQLLPKFALQYKWEKGNNVYATVSRGYRSGGYNIPMFSDLVRKELRNAMITVLSEQNQLAGYKEKLNGFVEAIHVKEEATYKPEYTWNYETGSHLTLWNGKLLADFSAFYMDTRDQQVSHFVESGAGRLTVNVGKSRSYGAEAALKASVTNGLTLNGSYGYTHAAFRDYETINNNNEQVNYTGNYVPFTPMHTFNIGAQYLFRPAAGRWPDQIQLDANYNGAARIYWTERNNARQPFYGKLDVRVAFNKGNGQVALWGRNVLNKEYGTFYFESMGENFMQKGRPIQFGIDLRYHF